MSPTTRVVNMSFAGHVAADIEGQYSTTFSWSKGSRAQRYSTCALHPVHMYLRLLCPYSSFFLSRSHTSLGTNGAQCNAKSPGIPDRYGNALNVMAVMFSSREPAFWKILKSARVRLHHPLPGVRLRWGGVRKVRIKPFVYARKVSHVREVERLGVLRDLGIRTTTCHKLQLPSSASRISITRSRRLVCLFVLISLHASSS